MWLSVALSCIDNAHPVYVYLLAWPILFVFVCLTPTEKKRTNSVPFQDVSQDDEPDGIDGRPALRPIPLRQGHNEDVLLLSDILYLEICQKRKFVDPSLSAISKTNTSFGNVWSISWEQIPPFIQIERLNVRFSGIKLKQMYNNFVHPYACVHRCGIRTHAWTNVIKNI